MDLFCHQHVWWQCLWCKVASINNMKRRFIFVWFSWAKIWRFCFNVALIGNFTHDGSVFLKWHSVLAVLFDSLWCFRANSDIVQVIAKVGGARQQDMGTIFKLAQNYSSCCSDQVLFPSQSPFLNVSSGQRSDCHPSWCLPKTIGFEIFQHQNRNSLWRAVWC